MRLLYIAVVSCSIASAPAVAAMPIPDLYTTGVDDSHQVLPPGATDSHYVILETLTNPFVVGDSAWIPDGNGSMWVWQNADKLPAHVTRTFELTFDLTGFDPATANILGSWATDNAGLDIRINGISTGQTSAGYGGYSPFSILSGFASGLNTLEFDVADYGGIAGFRVGTISGTADYVPEPAALLLAGIALLTTAMRWRARF